jgi:hypothetical protein
MKLSELSRYWAAKELTRIVQTGNKVKFHAPFACPDYTISTAKKLTGAPSLTVAGKVLPLHKVSSPLQLRTNTWYNHNKTIIICFNLPKGTSELSLS